MEAKISCLLLIMNNSAGHESQVDLMIGSSVRQTDPLGHGRCWIGAEESALRESSKKMLPAAKRKNGAQLSMPSLFFLSLPPM